VLAGLTLIIIIIVALGGIALRKFAGPPTSPNPSSTSPLAVSPTPKSGSAVSADTLAADQCSDIKEVLSFAPTFDQVRLSTKTADGWNVSKHIRGYATCYITHILRDTFMCESPPLEASAADAFFISAKQNVEACLGDGWTPTPATSSSALLRELSTGRVASTTKLAGSPALVALSLYVDGKPEPVEPAAAIHSATAPLSFCGNLKKVLAEANTKFRHIEGRLRGPLNWTARLQLEGFDDCDITGGTPIYYSCKISPFTSLDNVNQDVNDEAQYIKACLGTSWVRSNRFGVDNSSLVDFEAGPNDPVVNVHPYYDSMRQFWQLHIDVDAKK
jgi:hypothetical protein